MLYFPIQSSQYCVTFIVLCRTYGWGFLLHLQVHPGIEVVGGDVDVVERGGGVVTAGAGNAVVIVLASQPHCGLTQGTCLT